MTPVISNQQWSVKLISPINSRLRSLPLTTTACAFEVEIDEL
jgi:hypothetical protein